MIERFELRCEGLSDPPEAYEDKNGEWINYNDVASLIKLVDAVTCGDISGLKLNDVDGKNWFDFRREILNT